MAAAPRQGIPTWEQQWPGLLEWELERLRERAQNVEVDNELLKEGRLVVSFDWPLPSGLVKLQATFPGGYPFLRPQVCLLTVPDSWPDRHVSPIDGNVCLLGRDTAQWTPDWYLVKLLDEQLEDALLGKGSEDPQGEPADVWWNSLAPLPNSYCLIDSDWDLGDAESGKLEVHYVVGGKDELSNTLDRSLPPFRAVVTKVVSSNGSVLGRWTGPLPEDLKASTRRMTIPWHRSETTLLPRGQVGRQLAELRKIYFGGLGAPHGVAGDLAFRSFAIAHPIEIGHKKEGLGWIVGGEWGSRRDFQKRPGAGDHLRLAFLPVMRAGDSDLDFRVPAVDSLKQKRIAIFGVGAIGAPIAIELARNGCPELRLLDHDTVEPGNSIRWPLGVEAWGRSKVLALKQFIEQQYPSTTVVPHCHHLGGINVGSTDDGVLETMLAGIDLVIDAAVSDGVSRLLWQWCYQSGIPLIKVGATPSLGGGTVVRHTISGGCPVCLQWARDRDRIPKPPGADGDIDALAQPPGCGERTFSGADYDLQELSLQAVRLVVDTLDSKVEQPSIVQTLSLADASGKRILPNWQENPLLRQPECCGKVSEPPLPA